ncbi:ABC transporter substrate-binding protein [Shewanella sp. C32]|uniref:ABC transporter substrate-binding protein n=1 Tax=Shewanella electrica TaxID=515560 RepID=A0ABT2FIQ8_9GAMM|nr:ABC transporter substrate-binding protein [Shewanella electrica]MCH1925299.1 ABC transporter substrate-binding protein [Shewanella electrica]MCS4555124.1 ABC transporter substrate-binding protein [Shewanella electrica]
MTFSALKQPWILALSLVSLLGLSACTQPPANDLLTISGPFEPISLDLAKAGYIYSRMQIVETLVDVADNGELIPGLAQSWQSNADATVWQFTLKPKVKFHNGAPVTPAAVINSLRIAMGKPAPFDTGLIQSASELNDHQVQFTLTRPYRAFAAVLTNYTTAILAPESYDKRRRITQLIGTGPYQLTAFDPPHSVSVTRFNDYHGQVAKIVNATYITGHRAESRALMVQGGSADIVYNLDPAAVQLLQHSQQVTVNSTAIPRSILIKLNAGLPALSSTSVRQALSLAIDRRGIAEGIMHLPGSEANQIFGPAMGIWHVKDLPTIEQNLTQAEALLAQAGWHKDANGQLMKDGQPLQLSMVTYANRPELIVIATAIQAQWAKLGIALEVQMENASAIPLGHVEGTLQTALMARNFANIPDPLTVLLADFSSKQGGEWGPMNWQDAPFFSALQTTADSQGAAYQQGVQQLSRHLAEELPMIPVLYYVQQSAVAARVHGFSFDPYERSFRISQMELR